MKRRGILALLGLTTTAAFIPKADAQPKVPDLKGKIKANEDYGPIGIPIGIIIPWSPNANATPPNNWLVCDGRALTRSHYHELFAAIGTTFGPGDGHSTFNLPDLRPKLDIPYSPSHSHYVDGVPFSFGSPGGPAFVPGPVGGAVGAWASPAPPAHQHQFGPPVYTTGRYIGNGEYEAVAVHNHMQPTMVIQHIIRAL